LADVCIGNDGLYGGLGGEFTVITASEINGPLVLRHELGHSLIEEGDEYDGSKRIPVESEAGRMLKLRLRVFWAECCKGQELKEGPQVERVPLRSFQSTDRRLCDALAGLSVSPPPPSSLSGTYADR
jgi:hypothetical protein